MKMKIGADELILWLRKNNYANNKTTIRLGLDILNLIKGLGGEIIEIERDTPCYWDCNENSKNIGELKLPQTASQYFIDSKKLGELYDAMSKW
jgi:hypothetical protein